MVVFVKKWQTVNPLALKGNSVKATAVKTTSLIAYEIQIYGINCIKLTARKPQSSY